MSEVFRKISGTWSSVHLTPEEQRTLDRLKRRLPLTGAPRYDPDDDLDPSEDVQWVDLVALPPSPDGGNVRESEPAPARAAAEQ